MIPATFEPRVAVPIVCAAGIFFRLAALSAAVLAGGASEAASTAGIA